jgi:hypothetical protein
MRLTNSSDGEAFHAQRRSGRLAPERLVPPSQAPNGKAFSGEPSERSERPERSEGRRVRWNAMLGVLCYHRAVQIAERVNARFIQELNE